MEVRVSVAGRVGSSASPTLSFVPRCGSRSRVPRLSVTWSSTVERCRSTFPRSVGVCLQRRGRIVTA